MIKNSSTLNGSSFPLPRLRGRVRVGVKKMAFHKKIKNCYAFNPHPANLIPSANFSAFRKQPGQVGVNAMNPNIFTSKTVIFYHSKALAMQKITAISAYECTTVWNNFSTKSDE